MGYKKRAVILLAFGCPDSLDDVEPFLNNIVSGRRLSEVQVEEIKDRYRCIGGKSPLKKITHRQAVALQNRLNADNDISYSVYTGMRFWHPLITETLSQIYNDGIRDVTAIIMSPQRSGYTVKGYKHDIDNALKKLDLDLDLEINVICEWHRNKFLLEALSEEISKVIPLFGNEKGVVIFSAHSLPVKFMKPDDPYICQIEETIQGIISRTIPFDWKLGYQSKGMIPGDWLEPSVDSLMEELASEGYKNIAICPVGFVSDHIETLYDIDIIYSKKAEALGLVFCRTRSLNDSPLLIEALSDIVLKKGTKAI